MVNASQMQYNVAALFLRRQVQRVMIRMMHMTDSTHHSTNTAVVNASQMPHATLQNHKTECVNAHLHDTQK